MPRNIEIKARLDDLETVEAAVARMADEGPIALFQDDTFFHCPNGRLKLRTFAADHGELIFYRRDDARGPKESFYVRAATSDPAALREALALAHGATGRVIKHRTLYLVGRTRVHLDRVKGLGDFLELEVVLDDREPVEAGMREADDLMARLQLRADQLVEAAYVDLLRHG